MALNDLEIERLRTVVGADTFDGRFEIIAEAGAGGMGRVYEAIDCGTNRRVAVKIMLNLGNRERFLAEAEILEKLDHPAIVSYVRHGATNQGDPYLVMEWLVGENLSRRLERGPLGIIDAAILGEQLASALAYAHAADVVHRDLKPSNVLLIDGDVARAKLMDFGVAKTSRDLTRTGQLIGTPGYMAPEQVRGEKGVDRRVDLFALGCVLYEVLAGCPPFGGADVMEVLARLLLEAPKSIEAILPAIPPRMARLIGSLLAKDPEYRLADAAIARDELATIHAALVAGDSDALARGGANLPMPDSAPAATVASPRPRTKRWLFAAGATAAVAIAATIATATLSDDDAHPPCTNNTSAGCHARCEDGDGEACFREAQALYNGLQGQPRDRPAARAAYVRSCELGWYEACASGAGKLLRDVENKDHSADGISVAEKMLVGACDAGYIRACRQLGVEHVPGSGKLAPDGNLALALIGQACAGDEFPACSQLRKLITDEVGDPASRSQAEVVVQAACVRNPHLRRIPSRGLPTCGN